MTFFEEIRSKSKLELRSLLEGWLGKLRDTVQGNGERALVGGLLAGMVLVLLTRLVFTVAFITAIGFAIVYYLAPEDK